MATDRTRDGGGSGRGERRLDVVLVLAFAVMLAGGLALFPLSVTANKLSGLWMTFCASIGLG